MYKVYKVYEVLLPPQASYPTSVGFIGIEKPGIWHPDIFNSNQNSLPPTNLPTPALVAYTPPPKSRLRSGAV